jgi:hypothetical protein
MFSRSPLAALALLVWAAVPAAPAAEPLPDEVREVRDCAKRNFPEHSARQKLRIERSARGSDARQLDATLLWRRADDGLSRLHVTVDAPEQERGTAFLLIERDGEDMMFSYLPEYRKVRRITSRAVTGSFLGTDLSYEDFQQLQGLADEGDAVRLPDETLDGRATYVIEVTPAGGAASSYERVRTWIDRETCVLRRAELAGPGVDRVVEVAWADVERSGERWIPKRLLLRDRAKESETRLSLLKVEWDVELPERLFNESELGKGN